MNKLLLSYFILQLLISQKDLTIYSTMFDYRVDLIERTILENTIKLYNKSVPKKETFILNFVKKRPFEQVLEALLKHKRTDNVMSIASISATSDRKRKYESSSIYFPNQEVICSLIGQEFLKNETWHDGISPVAYQRNTIEELIVFDLKRKYRINSIAFETYDRKLNALLSGRVLFSISDRVEIWDDDRLKVFEKLDNQYSKGFAFFYPKGSLLKEKLDNHLQYYIKSPAFFLLIESKYGKEIRDYFIKELKKL